MIIGKSPKRRMEGTVIPGDWADWRNGEQKEKGSGEGAEREIRTCHKTMGHGFVTFFMSNPLHIPVRDFGLHF